MSDPHAPRRGEASGSAPEGPRTPGAGGAPPGGSEDDPARPGGPRGGREAIVAEAPPDNWRGRIIARLRARGRYPTWVLLAALAGMFATTFPITILTVSLGTIADEFGAPETLLAWVISAPMLLSAVALPLLGKLGDLYGHRRVFLAGFAANTAIAFVTALAWDPYSLIAMRTVAAVIGGATQPTSMALIMGVYAKEERVKAMGWWAMTAAGAPAVGLVAGGPVVDALGWRLVFVAQGALALGALAIASVVLLETVRQRVRFDVLGSATLAVGVAGFMFLVSQGPEMGLRSPWVLGSAACAAVGLTAFVQVERRAPAPLLPLDFFRRRNFSAPIVANAMLGAAYMGAFILAPLVLLHVFGFSVSMAALIMLCRTLTFSVSSPLGGNLGARVGERGAAVAGTSAVALALCVMAYAVSRESLPLVMAGLVLQGLGNGLALPSLTSSVSNSVPEEDLGIASASQRLTNQAGSAFGITLLTVVYGGVNAPDAFARAFLVGAALAAASLAASTLVRAQVRRHRPWEAEPAAEASEG